MCIEGHQLRPCVYYIHTHTHRVHRCGACVLRHHAPLLMTSLLRSVICMPPQRSSDATSPVGNQLSPTVAGWGALK